VIAPLSGIARSGVDGGRELEHLDELGALKPFEDR
jgi:hypothetical protein